MTDLAIERDELITAIDDGDVRLYAHPAAVRATDMSVESLTKLAKAGAMNPDRFNDNPPFFWRAEISSDRMDAYFTRMDPSTLKNFATDANAGVSFQNSHNTRQLGLGHSLAGKYYSGRGSGGDGTPYVLADFYTVHGIRTGDMSTDDFIVGIETGLYRDVSVGFHGGQFECNICGLDMMRNWDCWHIPGMEYSVETGKKSKSEETILCFAWIKNARLAEVSQVFDGATPGAGVIKAMQEAEGGRMRPELARAVEAVYRIKLPGTHRIWTSGIVSPGGEERTAPHDDDDTDREVPEITEVPTPAQSGEGTPETSGERSDPAETTEAQVDETTTEDRTPDGDRETQGGTMSEPRSTEATSERDLVAEAMADLRTHLERIGNIEIGADLNATVRNMVAEIERLRPLADDGRAYRTNMIDEAIREGVRATGDGFAEETYKSMLANAPLDAIKRFRDDWKTTADKLFPGGRSTKDEADATVETEDERSEPADARDQVPNAVYAA